MYNKLDNYLSLINKVVNRNMLSHAYLIEVNDVNDDLKYILSFIKLILCQQNKDISDINCGSCEICKQLDDGNYIDLKIIEPDGSSIKKQQMIELQASFKSKSFLNNKMIYLIKNVEKLNVASANTILKFLEEPADNIIAFLITDNRYNVLDTIISRCQVLSIKKNNLSVESNECLNLFIESLSKCDYLFINQKKLYNEFFVDKIIAQENLKKIQKILISYLNYKNNIVSDFDSTLFKYLNNMDERKIINCIDIIEIECDKLSFNVNYKLWIDSLFAKLIGE